MTAEIRRRGMREAFGVDRKLHRQLKCPASFLDLRTPSGQEVLLEMLDDEDLIWVHFAPSSKTTTRARDLRRHAGYDPPKLRSDCEPDGLSTLSGSLLERVTASNELYTFTGLACSACWDRGIMFSVEHPVRSYMWDTSSWQQHTSNLPLRHCLFQHCMFGGPRDKTTRMCHVVPTFDSLALMCDGSHTHAPWGTHSPDDERRPPGLCKALASCLIEQALEYGATAPPAALSDLPPHKHDHRLAQIAQGKQPRGKRVPPLVAEFRAIVELTGPREALPPVKLEEAWMLPANVECVPPQPHLPPGSRLIRLQPVGGRAGSSDEIDGVLCKAVFGIPWSIDEFMAKALYVRHPRLLVNGIPKEIHASIEHMVSSPSHSLMAERSETLRRWLARALSLKEDEDNLKSELPDHCRRVLYKKRLLLFGELLAEVGHPDTAIASQMAGGFDLVGRIPMSGVFNKRKSMAALLLRICEPLPSAPVLGSCSRSAVRATMTSTAGCMPPRGMNWTEGGSMDLTRLKRFRTPQV